MHRRSNAAGTFATGCHVRRGLAENLGMRTDAALDEAFGASVPRWPTFPDTADALRALKRRYRWLPTPPGGCRC